MKRRKSPLCSHPNPIPKDERSGFPVGRLLVRFLDMDFQPYENTRKRLEEQVSSGLAGPAAVVAEVARLVRSGFGSDFGHHPYFRNIRLNEEDSDRNTALEWLKTYDYFAGQRALAIAVQLCLDADGPIHLVSFSASERYLIGRALEAFHLPVQPESLHAGYSFADPSRLSSIEALLDRSGERAADTGGQRLGNLGVPLLVRLKDHFRDFPPQLSEGYADNNPLILATAEFMENGAAGSSCPPMCAMWPLSPPARQPESPLLRPDCSRRYQNLPGDRSFYPISGACSGRSAVACLYQSLPSQIQANAGRRSTRCRCFPEMGK